MLCLCRVFINSMLLHFYQSPETAIKSRAMNQYRYYLFCPLINGNVANFCTATTIKTSIFPFVLQLSKESLNFNLKNIYYTCCNFIFITSMLIFPKVAFLHNAKFTHDYILLTVWKFVITLCILLYETRIAAKI